MLNESEILQWQYGHTGAMMTVLALVAVVMGLYALWRPVDDGGDTSSGAD